MPPLFESGLDFTQWTITDWVVVAGFFTLGHIITTDGKYLSEKRYNEIESRKYEVVRKKRKRKK